MTVNSENVQGKHPQSKENSNIIKPTEKLEFVERWC